MANRGASDIRPGGQLFGIGFLGRYNSAAGHIRMAVEVFFSSKLRWKYCLGQSFACLRRLRTEARQRLERVEGHR
jgi:hypothetical protein